jgi:protein subunit release factor A
MTELRYGFHQGLSDLHLKCIQGNPCRRIQWRCRRSAQIQRDQKLTDDTGASPYSESCPSSSLIFRAPIYQLQQTYEDTVQLFDSPELLDLATVETDGLLRDLRSLLVQDLPNALLPSSETEGLSALVELKAGVGGSESSLFTAELLRMYGRFTRLNGWEPTVLASSESDSGGFKDVILEVNGCGAYDTLRWESGVHRVQRVPATEASGRLHTSTVAAVVSKPTPFV